MEEATDCCLGDQNRITTFSWLLAQRKRRHWTLLHNLIEEVNREDRHQTVLLARHAREISKQEQMTADDDQGGGEVKYLKSSGGNREGYPLSPPPYDRIDKPSTEPLSNIPLETTVKETSIKRDFSEERAKRSKEGKQDEGRGLAVTSGMLQGKSTGRQAPNGCVMVELLAGSATLGKRVSKKWLASGASTDGSAFGRKAKGGKNSRFYVDGRVCEVKERGKGQNKTWDKGKGKAKGKYKHNCDAATDQWSSFSLQRPINDDKGDSFASLHVCTVRLGAVTQATISTWARGLGRLGGNISTDFVPDVTTHIVVDPSLHPGSLAGYSGWETMLTAIEAASKRKNDKEHGGLDGKMTQLSCSGGKTDQVAYERALLAPQVMLVRSNWLVDCLRHGTVVDETGHILVPDPVWGLVLHSGDVDSSNKKQQCTSTIAIVPPPPEGSGGSISLPLQEHKGTGGVCGEEECLTRGARRESPIPRGEIPAPSQELKTLKSGGWGQYKGDIQREGLPLPMGSVKGGFGGVDIRAMQRRGRFACQASVSSSDKVTPHNEAAAAVLEELAGVFDALKGQGDNWRAMGFKRAAGVLRRLDVEITSVTHLEVHCEMIPQEEGML